MANTAPSESYKFDSAAVFAAVIIVGGLLFAFWVIKHVFGGADEAQQVLHFLLPITSVPLYNELCVRFRGKKAAEHAETYGPGYRNLFSSAFMVALVALFLLEFISFLAGASAGYIVASMFNERNVQALNIVITAISFFVVLPVLFLFCAAAGWLLGRSRVKQPFRFAGLFFGCLVVLNAVDAIVTLSSEESKELLQLQSSASIAGYVTAATLLRPAIFSIGLLSGFFLKYVWTSIFGERETAALQANRPNIL